MTTTDPVFRSCDTYTQREFARWVESLPRGDLHHYELLNGSIVREPPAGWPHGEIAAGITAALSAFVRPRRLGRLFDSSQGFELPTGDTVEPDCSFVSNGRWAALSKPVRGHPRVAPDLVVEILSPSTRRLDETEKRAIYERSGVLELVLVDPAARCVTQLVAGPRGYGRGRVRGCGAHWESPVLPGLTVPIAELFPDE